MIKIILSHDESQKIGRHILNGRPYIFENVRVELGTTEVEIKIPVEIIFREYKGVY